MPDKKSKEKSIELDEMCLIVRVPKGALKLKVTATIQDEKGNEVKAKKLFGIDDILKMRQDFLDNVASGDDFDAPFEVTEEGFNYLNSSKECEK